MKKGILITGITTLLAVAAGCLLLTSCNGDSLPGLEAPELPSGWIDKHPVLDLTRSFSSVVPVSEGRTGNAVA